MSDETRHAEKPIKVLTDANGKIKMFNAAAQEITGYDESEVIGQNILDFFVPPAWRPAVLERFSRTWSESLRQPHHNPWLSKSRQEIMIEWRCIGVRPPGSSLGSRPWVYGIGVVVTGSSIAGSASFRPSGQE